MTAPNHLTRRSALGAMAAGLAAPFVWRHTAGAAPSETLLHASFGASGMAGSDIGSLTASKNLKLVAVAEVDAGRAADIKKKFPDLRVYTDWRVLLDKEKDLHSVNVSTPDHMHAPITMTAIHRGLHVYTQKPLTQTIYEARQLTKAAADKKVVSQMGIQIHSAAEHRTIVATVQAGAIGKVKEVHSWSGKQWGDRKPRPDRKDPIPPELDWDVWLGVAADRPYIGNGYYHPGNWRKRLDFGTGTFGDMGCHILDPVFGALALTAPTSVRSEGDVPNDDSWGLDNRVVFTFPGTKHTTEAVTLTWYNGTLRPPEDVLKLARVAKVSDQGSIYVGTEGVMYSPYIAFPTVIPNGGGPAPALTRMGGENHYLQFVEACRGNGTTSAPFAYSGPLTESVLLGCLATRFPKTTLQWDAAKLKVTNEEKANQFVRKTYRKGWEVEGL
jgi:predicted dehydrogenase